MMNYRIRVLLACLLLCTCPSRPLKAQANFPFSLYSFVFQDLCWNGDTSKYIDNEIKDTAALFSVYRSYRFTTPEFYQAYPNIQHAPALSNDIPAIPQNRTLNFSLFGKDGKAQNIFYSGNDTSTCIFVIPGSGINQSTSILNQLWNYHNLNCYIPSFLQNYGDVYLYVKPNEDYRAHWTTQFGPMRKINELGIIQTLMGMGRSYAANYLIECIAMVRYLKSRYNKVLVIGLSQGGSAALYTGLQSEPDAVYVASGYSILFDNAYPASNSNQIYFDSILSYYQSGLVRSSIEAQNSEYLFGWNTNEGVYFSDYEAQTNATKNFFQGVPNIKATTTYFSPGQHTFNCGAMDTFFNYVKSKPKVQLIADSSGCTSDSLILRLHFRGTAPYSFNLYRNGIVLSSHLSPSDTMNIPVYVGGTYEIRDLLDVGNVPGYRSAPLNYVQPPKANLSITGRSFECDSNRTAIQVQLQGTPPFAFTYSMNQNVLSQNTSQSNLTLYAQTDSVHLGTLIDARSCLHQPDTNLVLKDSALQVQLSAPVWDCDSNQVRLDLLLEGKAPWTLFYKVNGLHDSVVLLNTSASVWFGNGVHEMTGIRDANQCWKTLNQVYTFSFQPVSATASIPFYACDSNKTRITFTQQGNAPFTLHYTFDAAPMQMSFNGGSATQDFINGNYQFLALSDATGCVDSLNLSYVFAYDTVDAVFGNPVYDCDSNKTRLPLDLQGNGPWVMNYTLNGVPAQMNFASANNLLYLDNGLYNVLQVQDQTGCVKTLNQVFSFSFQPISATASIPFYACDSNKTRITFTQQGNAPFTLHYTFDAAPMQMSFNGGSATQDFINGNYQFLAISDATGCVDSLNLSYVFAYDTVDAVFGNPVYDCDSNKTRLPLDLQGNGPWVMNYTLNGVPAQMNFASANNLLYLGNGIYNVLQVQDQTGCVKTLNQVFSFSFQPISATASIPFYACDSNKTRITFTQQGNAPFTLHYTFDAAPMQMNFNGGSATQDFINGNYQFLALSDATGCVDSLNLSYTFSYDTVDAVFGNPVYDCDSNKTRLPLDLQGNGPWVMNYTLNGVAAQMNFASANNLLYLGNGIYNFLQVQDQTGCVKTLNQVFNFNFQAISATASVPFYACDSNKTRITFTQQGNAPFTLHYTFDAAPMQMSFNGGSATQDFINGNYQFLAISDATGCVDSLNLSYTFSYDTVNAVFGNPVYDCDSNKTRLPLDLQGNGPWVMNYTLNGVAAQMNFASANNLLYLGNGIYNFLQVQDQTGCVKTLNQVFNFNFQAISATASVPFYACDSNKTRITFTQQGNAPFTLHYTFDAAPMQMNFNGGSATQDFINGNYQFLALSDATGCVDSLNLSYVFAYDTVDAVFGNPVYDCDSNKTRLPLDLQGNGPWVMNYTLNGVPAQINFASANNLLYLGNGIYNFLQVQDQTGCVKTLNQVFSFSFQPISATASIPFYACDSNKTRITFTQQGNAPFTLHYTFDAAPMQMNFNGGSATQDFINGNYQFLAISDATGCVDSLNLSYTFSYDTVDAVFGNPVYDCDSNKTRLPLDLQGNGPWVMTYTLNGVPAQMNFASANNLLYLGNGIYNFLQVQDQTGCVKTLNQVYSFSFQPVAVQVTQQQYDCDSSKYRVQFAFTGNGPWVLSYELQGGFTFTKTFTQATGSIWLSNGQWIVHGVTDQTGCSVMLNLPLTVNLTPINAVISNQTYDCDSNKMRVHFQLQGNSPFQITYQQNPGGNFTTLSTNSAAPVLFLPAGIYQFTTVSDLTGCVKTLNQNISNPYSPLTVQKTGTHFQCDSNKVRIDYQFGGDGPWTIQYRNLGTATNFQKLNAIPSASLFLPTGQYVIQSVSDTKCTVTLADTMQINFPALTATLNTPTILCDSEITHTTLQVSTGLKPFTLHYTFNNQPASVQTQLNNLQVLMPNGLYYFSHVSDSAGCIRNLGMSHTAQYTPLHVSGISSRYLCGVDSTELSVGFSGTQPSLLLYSKNGGPLDTLSVYPGQAFRQSNGTYFFSHLRDAAGCTDSILETKVFDYKSIAFAVDSINPMCQERSHKWTLSVNGQAPWTLHYLYRNAPDSLQISSPSFEWKTQPGDYHLQRISDASGCEQIIQRRDTLFDFLSFEPKLETDYRMVSVQASPLWHAWYYEGRKVDSGAVMQIPVRGTGAYWVTLTDSTGCHYISDTLDLSYPAQVSLYPNPAHDEASLLVQDDFGEYWRYRITDGRGFTIQEGLCTQPYQKLNVGGLSSGIYQVMITYASDGGNHKRVLKLVKQ